MKLVGRLTRAMVRWLRNVVRLLIRGLQPPQNILTLYLLLVVLGAYVVGQYTHEQSQAERWSIAQHIVESLERLSYVFVVATGTTFVIVEGAHMVLARWTELLSERRLEKAVEKRLEEERTKAFQEGYHKRMSEELEQNGGGEDSSSPADQSKEG